MGGLVITGIVWQQNKPYNFTTYGHYLITCDNGVTFDPSSLPIKRFTPVRGGAPIFDEWYIKTECVNSYHGGNDDVIASTIFGKRPYKYTYKTYHYIKTVEQQIMTTSIVFVSYYLVLEVLRRAFLYIIFGRNFITGKKSKE